MYAHLHMCMYTSIVHSAINVQNYFSFLSVQGTQTGHTALYYIRKVVIFLNSLHFTRIIFEFHPYYDVTRVMHDTNVMGNASFLTHLIISSYVLGNGVATASTLASNWVSWKLLYA